jgi:hypothetical protein
MGGGGELNSKIFKLQKRVIRVMAGVNSKTSCRHLFKELNIFTLSSLYILEVTCFKKGTVSLWSLMQMCMIIIQERRWISVYNHTEQCDKYGVKNLQQAAGPHERD